MARVPARAQLSPSPAGRRPLRGPWPATAVLRGTAAARRRPGPSPAHAPTSPCSVLLSPSGVTRLVDSPGAGGSREPGALRRRRPRLLRRPHRGRRPTTDGGALDAPSPASSGCSWTGSTDADLRVLAGYWDRVVPGAAGSDAAWRRNAPDRGATRMLRWRPAMPDVIVVGAGIAGLCCARERHRRRPRRPRARARRRAGRTRAHRRGRRLPARPRIPGAPHRVPGGASRARLRAPGAAPVRERRRDPPWWTVHADR